MRQVKGGVIAIDYAEASTKFTQRLIKEEKQSIVGIARRDVEKMPFKSETFDILIAADLIEHLYHPQKFLQEMYRILNVEGKLILLTPIVRPKYALPITKFLSGIGKVIKLFYNPPIEEENLQKIEKCQQIQSKAIQQSDYDKLHVNLYTSSRLFKELQKSGFRIKEYDTFSRFPSPLSVILFNLFPFKRFLKLFKGNDIAVVCEK